MAERTYTAKEVVSKGKDIYESSLRAKLEEGHFGDYLVIDIETGEYEIDKDHLTASRRAREKNPNGERFAMRIGYKAMGKIGFGDSLRIE